MCWVGGWVSGGSRALGLVLCILFLFSSGFSLDKDRRFFFGAKVRMEVLSCW